MPETYVFQFDSRVRVDRSVKRGAVLHSANLASVLAAWLVGE